MDGFINNIKTAFRRGNVVRKLLYINTGIFLFSALLVILLTLFKRSGEGILHYFELPALWSRFLLQPWSILTYMFMHQGILHLLFNMLWLYWFGNLFLQFFSARHLRGLYLLGGFCGGIFYMVCYHIFPYFEEVLYYSYLLGASAAVLAIVAATAYQAPNYPLRLLFLGNIQLKYIALFVVVTDLLLLTSQNAGGHLSHLGGALGGWLFVVALKRGTDLTQWINKAIDLISFPFSSSRKTKPKMKVYYNKNARDYDYNARKRSESEDVDRILDKLKKSGYDSLTTEEKKRLFDASKK